MNVSVIVLRFLLNGAYYDYDKRLVEYVYSGRRGSSTDQGSINMLQELLTKAFIIKVIKLRYTTMIIYTILAFTDVHIYVISVR